MKKNTTKRKKQCTCHALMAGECVCGAWDEPTKTKTKLVPLCHECSAKLIDAGINLDAETEPFITIKELKQEYQKVRRKYSDFKLAVDALVCLLTAAKKASKR